MSFDISIKIAGQAGQGIQSIAEILLKVLKLNGLHVFAYQDYMSRVRGGHNFMQVRISDSPVYSIKEDCNILVALDTNSVDVHRNEVPKGGAIIYDPHSTMVDSPDNRFIPIPMNNLAKEVGSPILSNTISAGSILALLDINKMDAEEFVKKQFAKKGEEVIEKNLKALERGYLYFLENFRSWKFTDIKAQKNNKLIMINGSEAVGFGAIAGGCQFIAAYPMSPSTGVFTYITGKAKEFNIISEQAEDEIAAINMALGASFSGARAMTTTSGGGLSLMAEGLSLAGVMEAPVVVVNAQRPGPATGLATRTGQEDLEYVLHIGHGEFPRFVFAPGHPEEAFYTTIHAFNLSDKYQVPAFILIDQYFADTYATAKEFDLNKVKAISSQPSAFSNDYKRYQITKSGVSPRAYPMQGDFTFIADSHEHTENGHITEDGEVRNKMVEKRFRKLKGMQKEFGKPTYYYGDKLVPSSFKKGKAKTVFLAWGSNYGVVRETVDYLKKQKRSVAMLHFNRIYPFPRKEAIAFLKGAKEIITVENNYQGQFGNILKAETGIEVDGKILKYDGRPFTVEYILKRI
ncbi:MAG: 2-oxoacid:acceptor oxidoreductase subunit alpha [Nitrospinae bacterium]|nr:2-oxoacid:acceptor oxidoreductase subunit alpha [Nitrospinota bacterium]